MELVKEDFYQHSGSANPSSSDSNSDGDEHHEDSNDSCGWSSSLEDHMARKRAMDPDGAHSRFIQTQSSEEEDPKELKKNAVDPGAFRYNKRVFITALPCLLLTLLMTGELLLLIVTVGGMVIVLMTHMGEKISKRCVIVFALLFIPCHVLIVGTVLPLLWLSVWNLLLVGIVNIFTILTGGWIIIQFLAFRKEEGLLCATVEQVLFSIYPFICSALVTWVLSTVVSSTIIPFIFVFLWFVCLQLYLLPAVSSFKLTETVDEDLNVLQVPTIVIIVITFAVSGPGLHVLLAVAGKTADGIFSQPFFVLLLTLVCLGLFLSTLLGLRHLCDYFGWPHEVIVQVRWVSGAGVLLLSYPVLRQLGLVSHFLLSMPVAVAGFTSLALTLSFKKGKMLSIILMAGLVLLLCLWLSQLPWSLTYFLTMIPLKLFYGLVAFNFVLCVFVIFASWHTNAEVFGLLLLLQTTVITMCEMSLLKAGLYSLPVLQMTGITASYTFHRLYLASKLTRNMATVTSALQLTKTAISVLSYLLSSAGIKEGGNSSVDIMPVDFITLLLFVGMLVLLFIYETKEEITPWEAGKHMTLLMLSLAISSQSFLIPVAQLLLQEDPTLADLVGLWYVLGGVLLLLYALQHSQSAGLLEQLLKGTVVLGGVGTLVFTTQPQFTVSAYATYQWSEMFSILLIATLLTSGVEISFTQTLIIATILGICPGVHVTFVFYGREATVLHFILLTAITCILLAYILLITKMQEVTLVTETFFKMGTVLVAALLVTMIAVDMINLQPMDKVWNYPVWQLTFGILGIIALSFRALALKLGPGLLPTKEKEDHSLRLIPVIGNVATVLTFLLARTQGPQDGLLLHDLWCSASSIILILLQRDNLLLSYLSPSNRATPTVMAAVTTLLFATITQSRLWLFSSVIRILCGFLEIVAVLSTLPIYIVLAGVMWYGEIWSEKAVVFTLPVNAFVFLFGSSFTSWALSLAGFVSGIGMMMYKFPLVPYSYQELHR